MIRMEYHTPLERGFRVEWFRDKNDAMRRVEIEGLEGGQYKMRWVGFRFRVDGGNTDSYPDPDGNLIRGEEGAILHWLNRFAV